MRLSAARARRRPFDPAKQTNASGGWVWVDLPQSVLLNNRGIAADCALGAYGNAQPISCAPAAQWVPPGRSAAQPWASPSNKGAARAAAACCMDALARAVCRLPGQTAEMTCSSVQAAARAPQAKHLSSSLARPAAAISSSTRAGGARGRRGRRGGRARRVTRGVAAAQGARGRM